MNQNHLENLVRIVERKTKVKAEVSFSTKGGLTSDSASPSDLFKEKNLYHDLVETIEIRRWGKNDSGWDVDLSFTRDGSGYDNISLRIEADSREKIRIIETEIMEEIQSMNPPLYSWVYSYSKVLKWFYYTITLGGGFMVLRFWVAPLVKAGEISEDVFLSLLLLWFPSPWLLFLSLSALFNRFVYETGVFQIGRVWELHKIAMRFLSVLILMAASSIIGLLFLLLRAWLL